MAGTGLQPTIIALLYLFPGLALFVIAVRFWRKSVDRIFGGDDVLIGLAWILALGNTIITHLYVLTMRTGYKPEDMPKEPIDWARASKLQYALAVEYNPVICLVKASFLWSLYKLRSRNPYIRWSIIFMQGLNTVYMIATTIVSAISCIPVAKIFDPTIPGKCYDPYQYVLGNVSVVLITDFLVLLIPTALIWDLQMPVARKLVTILFLSLGFIVIGIGIARLIWLLNAFQGKVKSYSVEAAYSAIECSLAMIGASGPTVKYILSRFIPWLRPSWEKASTKPSNYGYGGGYGNNSAAGGTRRTRPNTERGYDDLDSVSAKHEEIEMKNDWQWKAHKDSDAQSDEQRITDPHDGIVKSVEWTVSTREDSTAGLARGSDGRRAVQPTNVV